MLAQAPAHRATRLIPQRAGLAGGGEMQRQPQCLGPLLVLVYYPAAIVVDTALPALKRCSCSGEPGRSRKLHDCVVAELWQSRE